MQCEIQPVGGILDLQNDVRLKKFADVGAEAELSLP